MADGPPTRKRLVKDVVALTNLFTRERATGIEPAFSAWEADVLPLNYARVMCLNLAKVLVSDYFL